MSTVHVSFEQKYSDKAKNRMRLNAIEAKMKPQIDYMKEHPFDVTLPFALQLISYMGEYILLLREEQRG